MPADALYAEPPGPIEKPVVRSANSTISADFLYFPVELTDKDVTLTIRLADKDGHSVAGKRVYVSSMNSWGPDAIVQPEKPTDENGVTTPKMRPGPQGTHDSRIFATDLTDLVDAAQVAHVTSQSLWNTLILEGFSPYFDPRIPRLEPLPLRAGRSVTITMPLANRNTFAVEVTATFSASVWNIGSAGLSEEIGKVKKITLQPREHKDVSITWTPKEASHFCITVLLTGHAIMASLRPRNPVAASLLPTSFVNASPAPPSGDTPLGRQTHNFGPVEPSSDCKDGCQTINDMLGLIQDAPDRCYYPGSFAVFASKFDPLLHQLRDADLPCCFNPGADPACASFLHQIHRDRFGLKTLNNGSTFPTVVDCPTPIALPQQQARCDDYNAILRIEENLKRLAGILGCAGGKERPHLPFPETETLEAIKAQAEWDEKLTRFLSDRARKDDPELTKGLEDAEKNFGTLAGFLGRLIKAGAACEKIKKILEEFRAFFNAIHEINNAGCNSQMEAKGFDDLAKSVGDLAGNLPLKDLDPELAGIVSIFAQDQNFFQNMSCALNPECQWRREFQSVDGYIPSCQAAMSSPAQ